MPAPEKTKKSKSPEKGKLVKGKKGEAKKKGSSNMLLILSGVGVVVLLAVGITIFFLMSGDEKNKPVVAKTGPGVTSGDGRKGDSLPESGTPTGAPDIAEMINKLNETIDNLNDSAKYADASKALREALEGDLIRKAPDGQSRLLNAIKDKAKNNNNEGARTFLAQLMVDKNNPSLAQAAGKIYEEHLKKEGEKVALESEPTEEPTNYLPNKTDVLFDLKMKNFLDSDYQRGVFAIGAFKKEDIDRRLGLPANTIDQLVIGGIKDFNQVVGVIRTSTSLSWDDFKKTMQMDESGTTIKGKTYYLGKIDFMTEFLGQRMPGIDLLRTKAAFWKADARTIVYGDETTVKDLLENPPAKDKQVEVADASATPPQDDPAQSGSAARRGKNMMAGIGSTPGADASGTSGMNFNPAAGGQGGNTQQGVSAPPLKKTERFLTIDAKMQRLIRLTVDNSKESLIIFADKATSKVPVLTDYVLYLNQLPSVRNKDIDTLVMVLPAALSSPTVRLGLACKTRATVRDVSNDVEKILTRVGKEDLRELFGFEFQIRGGAALGAEQPAGQPSGLGGTGGVTGGFGSMGGTEGGSGGRGPGAGVVGRPGAAGGPTGAGQGGAGGGVGSDGFGPPGGAPAGAGVRGGAPAAGGVNAPAADDTPDGGTFAVERSDEYIIITTSIKSSIGDFIDKHVKNWMQQIRGSQEMATGKFRFGDVAASLEYYKTALTRENKPMVFPQGAYPRTFDAERGPRPYPASDRVSFLRELLPYIGDDRYFLLRDSIKPEESWRSAENLQYAQIVVPHFLNPAAGSNSAYVKVRGVDQALAATHFVGMAGVGPDAAYYPKSDPRAGIFGYERQTSPEDVKDGLSNTIYMIEADKALLGPWLQGGGATVRGTSLTGNDIGRRGGFSSPNYSGKPGVWVLMADGSARFLAKDISPDVFKALCTMAGSDTVGAVDLIANKVNLEVTPRNETITTSTTAKRKRVTEEEDAPPVKK